MRTVMAILTLSFVALLFGCSQHCEAHGDELQTDHLRTSYGLYRWPEGYFEARQKLFPHACSVLTGGCFVDLDDAGLHRVRFCPACRRAEAAWNAERDGPGHDENQKK